MLLLRIWRVIAGLLGLSPAPVRRPVWNDEGASIVGVVVLVIVLLILAAILNTVIHSPLIFLIVLLALILFLV